MKVPTRRRRNGCPVYADYFGWVTSMKVPARRRGNSVVGERARRRAAPLNESPRPNAGKFARRGALLLRSGGTSMKVPAPEGREIMRKLWSAANVKVPQ